MKKLTAALILVTALMVSVQVARTNGNPPPKTSPQQASTPPNTANQEQNIQEYIALLRSDVRQQKAEMMGAVMQLSAEEAAKFWPIYSEYDAELSKLNDLRVANIEEYGRVKQALGAVTAARFVQVEHQLLLIIDLQIASSLPIVGQGS